MQILLRSQLSSSARRMANHSSSCRRRRYASSSSSNLLLDKVLIANRGEIACRVMRTCRRLGIPTVAVYSVADGPHCAHALAADEAFLIGTGPTPTESYLRQDELLELALQTGAKAVHPGYGFLSERAEFAKACQNAGIQFVGPPAPAIVAMGSKSQSKAVMEAAGVPTTPGWYFNETETEQPQDADLLYHQAVHHVGFPLLIKAVAGGGGKGMRLVWKESEFRAALESCQRESQASFGDSSVLLEKYLIQPRHVEVQVVADAHGNCVHLWERDCSLQRRHQKIIEEAPASDLSATVRAKLGEMGKLAAQAVGYVNAGTVEFLLDTATLDANEDPEFYFCEMNTRLQVEHPITELITGIDLVEWQLRIAAGEELPIKSQDDIPSRGHAFEARIYAENPARNFFPATGQVWHHAPPANDDDDDGVVRVDTGLRAGQEISVYYDPMISKLIVHAPDRPRALHKLIRALKSYQIAGVPTNIDFLIQCAQHPTFARAGAINTGFLDDYGEDIQLKDTISTVPPLGQVAGTLAVLLWMENRIGIASAAASAVEGGLAGRNRTPWSSHWGSWRMGGAAGRARRVLHMQDGRPVTCTSHRDGSFDVSWNNDNTLKDEEEEDGKREDKAEERKEEEVVSYHVDGSMNADGVMEIVINGTQRIKLTTVLHEDREHGLLRVRMWPRDLPHDYFWAVDAVNPFSPLAAAVVDPHHHTGGGAEGFVQSPMPGKIARVQFAVGDAVRVGDVVVVMEAMKMEHACASPRAGIVTELRCAVGDVVDDGAVLFVVQDADDSEQKAAATEDV